MSLELMARLEQICWRCLAGTEEYPWTDFGLKAAWRRHRCNAAQFFRRQREAGIEPSVLFSLPGFQLLMVTIDVLHACDLGTTQDFLGNLFFEAMENLFVGANREARLKELWKDLKAYIKVMRPPSALQGLSPPTLSKLSSLFISIIIS